MEKTKTEQTTNEELELKTLEDVDKNAETKTEEPAEKSELEIENEMLKSELEKYKNKYTKAVEVNNQLYQRLTSENKPTSPNALQSILNKF